MITTVNPDVHVHVHVHGSFLWLDKNEADQIQKLEDKSEIEAGDCRLHSLCPPQGERQTQIFLWVSLLCGSD